MGMWPSAERSRMASRRLPSPMYPPSGKRRSQSPESSGPRCVCTFVLRTRVSRSPQFTSPLMPHIISAPPHPQLVNFRFRVEHLHRLKGAIDQPRYTVEKSQTKNIAIQEEKNRGAWQAIEIPLKPSSALRLSAEQIRLHFLGIAFRLQ